jgi:quinoprotein glucose dehydrogenase
MNRIARTIYIQSLVIAGCLCLLNSCETQKDSTIKQIDPAKVATLARSIEEVVKPQLAEGLILKLWAVDSLVADIVSIDIDDHGKLFFTRINRQKNSEFDIRGHQDWEIESIRIQSIEDKRNFLHRVLSPANSDKNTWLADLNHDGSHDWKDLTVEKEQVFCIQDLSGDGIADQSQLVIEDFHTEVTDAAGGILKHNDDLFVAIGPDMWRVNDTNGDGVADKKESISHGYGLHIGFGGHGMSGAEVGPEGKIYWQIGDIGFNGVAPDGKKWEHPNSGVIVRANPDGSDFEVFAYGNRNTHEFVFDEYGNLISEDNDGDHQGERERIVYVVNGADMGWRINWQFGKYRDRDNNTYKVWMDEKMHVPHFEGQAAYITPAIANYVSGPTGMLYNPGTALGPEWKNTFFVVEFVGNPSQSGLHAFKLKPKGATFELGETKKILGGVLPTGIDFGPDGSIYLADWIEGWNTKDYGRIWKLDVSSGMNKEREEVKKLLAEDFSALSDERLSELLKHIDMRVRQKSQFELATRGADGMDVFKANIQQTENQLARVNAIWGVSQLARKNIGDAAVLVPLLKDGDPEIRAQGAKWLGDVRYTKAGEALLPLLKDDYSRARFFAAEALGRIAFEPAINPIIELLQSNNDEDLYIRHAASLALARIGKAEPVVSLSSHPSRAVRLAAVVALRRMQHKGVATFLNDKDQLVVTEAARAINDDLSIVEALPDLGNVLDRTLFTNEAFVRRAINANLRVGTKQAMMNLIRYSSNEAAPAVMRAEAIAALSTWAKPSVLDRVDGRYRGEVVRDPGPVKQNAAEPLFKLTSSKEKVVRVAAVKAIGKLQIESATSYLMTKLRSDPDADVRKEAVKSLAAIQSNETGNAITIALQDKAKDVRATALDLLPKTQIEKPVMVKLLENVIQTKTVEERQAALTTLGALPPEYTKSSFEKFLTLLENKKLPVEVNLELSDAIAATKSQELKQRFKEITSRSSSDTLQASYAGALLGGNEDRGESVFYSHQTAQCVRCHSIGDYGGNAGPRLNGVANRLTREQLLESLINPDASLAPGYGTVSLQLSNGRKLNGILQEESGEWFKLKIGDKPDTTVLKKDVTMRKNAPSSMPPMRLLLSKKEIRDVVSFLAMLKEE